RDAPPTYRTRRYGMAANPQPQPKVASGCKNPTLPNGLGPKPQRRSVDDQIYPSRRGTFWGEIKMKQYLVKNTTWRPAHQNLLAEGMRLLCIAVALPLVALVAIGSTGQA